MEPSAKDTSDKMEPEDTSDKMMSVAANTSDKVEPNTKDSNHPTFVKIRDEHNDDIMELPSEEDGTIFLPTIQAQFPSAIGLRYNSKCEGLLGGWKHIKAEDNILHPPSDGWGEYTYYITKFRQSVVNVNKFNLRKLAHQRKLPYPTFETITVDNGFLSTVTFNGNQYKGFDICKTHKQARQAASLVALNALIEIPGSPVEECSETDHGKEGLTFKCDLVNLADREKLPRPTFKSEAINDGYISTVSFDGNQYEGMYVCKKLKHAENNAAQVALNALIGIPLPSAEKYSGARKKEQGDECVKPIPPMFKSKLIGVTKMKRLSFPTYETIKENNGFVSTVTINGKQYKGMGPWVTGKDAEDNAAQVAFVALTKPSLQCDQQHGDIVDKDYSWKRNAGTLVSDEEDSPPPTKSVKSLLKNPCFQKLVVLGLPHGTTNDDLKEYFTRTCGALVDHKLALNKKNKANRGFGFITFETEEATKKALNGEYEINGRKVHIDTWDITPLKLFVDGIPEGTTEERLMELFSQFGDICDISIPQPFQNLASVTFADRDDGEKVLKSFLQIKLDGVLIRVCRADAKKTKTKNKLTRRQRQNLKKDKYKKLSVNQQSLQQKSFNQQAFDQKSFNQQSFKQQSFNQQSSNPQSFNQQSYNQHSFNQQLFNQQSFNQQSLNRQSFNQQLFNQESSSGNKSHKNMLYPTMTSRQ